MQGVIVQFPEPECLPVTRLPNARLQEVEQKVDKFSKELGFIDRNSTTAIETMEALRSDIATLRDRIDKPRSGPSPWVTIAISAIAAVATFCTLGYNISKVDKLNSKIDGVARSIDGDRGLTARQAKFEASLRLVTAAVAPQLIHELDKLLDESAKAALDGNFRAASITLAQVADKANTLRQAGVVADQAFFSNAASTLNTISSKDAQIADPAWFSLATYHSAVVHPPNLATIFAPESKKSITTEELTNPKDHQSSLNGFGMYSTSATLQCPSGANVVGRGPVIAINVGDGDWARPVAGPRKGACRISNVAIVTPSQTLDGFVWNNVVFIGARIRYMGGPVTLKNVRFVNCTFDIPTHVPAKVGQPLLNYAIAQEPELILQATPSLASQGL
jgi:hypothetical protein